MKTIGIDDFCNYKSLSSVAYSKDGKTLVFAVTEADKDSNSYRTCLYMRKDGKITKLTNGGKEASFVWLDNENILFCGNREDKKEASIESKFYKINTCGGEAELFFTLPIPTEQIIPLDNGDFIVVCTVYPGFSDLYKGDKKRIKEYMDYVKENEDYEVLTQAPWWWNGGTFTHSAYSGLYYYKTKTKKLLPISPENMGVSDVKVDNEQKYVYFAMEKANVQKLKLWCGETLYRANLSEFKIEKVADSRDDFNIHTYEFAKSFILLIVSDGKYGMNTDPDFFAMNYDDFKISPYAKYGYNIGSTVGSDVRHGGGRSSKMTGDVYYFISTRFDSANIYKLENGNISAVTEYDGSVDCFDMTEKSMAMVALRDMRLQEIYDEKGRRLTNFNDKALAGKFVSQPESFNINACGTELHGFILKPYGFEKGKKYPIIIDIHGGPKTVYGPVFYHEMQHWAGKGYFVVFCNPIGSDGRGEYMNICGKYGTVDYEQIMTFCDAVLEKYPEADKDNFFETGGSYGGFMTNWIIGHTDRFRACASQRSISNWFSFCGVSDIGLGFPQDQCKADIWETPEKLWWHSPLRYADKVKTPTLFIHSFEDYRCPIDQGYQMYSALVDHGIETKLVAFKGENHELSRSGKPKHRIKRLTEITKWFDDHRG